MPINTKETLAKIISNITSKQIPFYHMYSQYFRLKKDYNHIGEFIFPNSRRVKLYITDKLDKDYSSILYGLAIDNDSYIKIGNEERVLEILEKLKNMSDTEVISKEIAQDL